MATLPASPFLDRTFDNIMAEMLAELPVTLDKREGSYIWDALAPAAALLTEAYITGSLLLEYAFLDTSIGGFLDAIVIEHGLARNNPTKAIVDLLVTGLQGTFIPSGTQFGTSVNPNAATSAQTYVSTQNKTIQPRAGNGTFQESYPSITYTGTWSSDASTKFSSVTNDKSDIYFNGTQIVIRFVTGPDKGIVAISIDGGAETTHDTYAAAPGTLDVTKGSLSIGNHKATARVNGTKNGSSTGFTINLDQFVVTGAEAQIIDSVTVPVEALVAGAAGNAGAGTIVRLASGLNGITAVTNTLAATGGRDIESDVDLKTRFKSYVAEPPGSGNRADYKKWAKEASVVVGDVDVQPLWAGNGTVKVFFLKTDGTVPDAGIIATVQAYIDPAPTGTGAGKAPIGATVTVQAPVAVPIDVNVTITYVGGYDQQTVKDAITASLRAYLSSVPIAGTIRLNDVGNAIHDTPGVLDYSGLQIRRDVVAFGTANIVLAAGEKGVIDVVTYA